jgi:aminopeptidase N
MGDPFASESADYTATITATPGVQIVAGGDMVNQSNVWHFELPRGRTFAFIASPNYLSMDVTAGQVTYSLYTFARHAHLMPVAMQTIVRSAQLYSSLYGAYPYTSLRVAEVSGPWSMEFSGLATLGADEFGDYNGTQRNRLVRIAAHEVSHQWWYGVVGNDQAREPWLDESLARFSELRYYEFYSPGDVQWWWNTVLANSDPQRTVDSTIYDFRFHNSYIGVVYNRGAILWDALRAQMGASAFDEFMREWYRRGEYRLATSGDLLALLDERSSTDLRPVLRRFLADAPLDSWRASDEDAMQTRSALQDRLRE